MASPRHALALTCSAFFLLSLLLPVCFCFNDVLFPNGTGIARADFPDGFLFGAITSSMKHEGAEGVDGKSDNIWDFYARREGASMDGAVPGQCGDNYHKYKADHQLMSGLGMNAYRFSIAWSRIYPNGSGEVNEVAIAHYNDVINSVIEEGLEPFVTLWTQDHPHILDVNYKGPLSSQFVSDFATYAETCFKAFGDRVKYWILFDEANDFAGLGYSTNQNPPGRCTSDIDGHGGVNYGNCPDGDSGTEPYIVGHNLILAHAEAADIYRKKYQASQNGSIGMALWFRWSEPLSNSTADEEAAQRATDFHVGWFLDPIFFGDYPASMKSIVGSRLPNFTGDEIAKVKGSLDFIGLNIQTAFYVYDYDWYSAGSKTCYYLDWGIDVTGERDGVVIGLGDNDYAVPWCIKSAVEYVKARYDNFPTYITQTGWAIEYNVTEDTMGDDERVEYFMTYYDQLSIAIRDGADVKGVFAWSLLDGFEFNLGLQKRVGIYYVDNNLTRYPRKSAMWFKEMLADANSTSENLKSLGSTKNIRYLLRGQ